jgi:hypothetical protein
MPNVADFDNQKLWMAACVPERTSEGDEHAQAVATCLSIWSEAHKAIDYNEEISAIRSEWNRQNPDGVMPVMEVGSWIVTVRSDAVIVEVGNKFYEVTYSKDDDDRVTFVPRTEWQEVSMPMSLQKTTRSKLSPGTARRSESAITSYCSAVEI